MELDWLQCRSQVNEILSIENNLKNITQLIGEENLPEDQQLILFIAKLIKEGFLIQNAFDDIDNYISTKKLLGQIKIILLLYKEAKELLTKGVIIEEIKDLESLDDILRISKSIPNEDFDKIIEIKENLIKEIKNLKRVYRGMK